jgi:hypothetical protein
METFSAIVNVLLHPSIVSCKFPSPERHLNYIAFFQIS